MSKLQAHLDILKADRRDFIDRMVATGDRVANMKGLATLQAVIAAFEAVGLEETIRLIEEDARELRAKFRSGLRTA
jgi:hypothetical protein